MIVDENGMCTLSEEDCSYHSHTAKRTNADRLRAMSDEELAMLIHDIVQAEMWRAQVRECITTETGWLDWLREEVPTNG